MRCGLGGLEEAQNPADGGFPDAGKGKEFQAEGMMYMCRELRVPGGRGSVMSW